LSNYNTAIEKKSEALNRMTSTTY